jgi:gluconolactonase
VGAIEDVVAAGATWQLVWQGTDNADGIVGMADGSVLFAQEQPNRISRLDRDNRVSVFLEGTRGAGSLAIDSRGRILGVERTCTDPGRGGRIANAGPCTEPTAIAVLHPARQVVADAFQAKPLGRLNDLVVDRTGGVYFTVGGAFFVGPARLREDASARVVSIADDIRSNGIMLSPDEKVLYVTNGPLVLAFDRRRDGSVTNRREFGRLDAGGSGDGMAVDAAGRLYITSAPGVQVLGAGGEFLGLVPTPRSVISVAFAGPDKKMLYVVGSGALGPDGREFTTPDGVRNNAKTIYRLPMLAQGFTERAK